MGGFSMGRLYDHDSYKIESIKGTGEFNHMMNIFVEGFPFRDGDVLQTDKGDTLRVLQVLYTEDLFEDYSELFCVLINPGSIDKEATHLSRVFSSMSYLIQDMTSQAQCNVKFIGTSKIK